MRDGEDVTDVVWLYLLGERGGNPHVDPEVAADIEVVFIQDSHVSPGIMRARTLERTTTLWGATKAENSVTKWVRRDAGPDLKAGADALREALRKEWDG